MGKAVDRYLYTVSTLHERYLCVRSVDVAHFLGVTKASVSAFVRHARDRGLLEMEQDGNLLLTQDGRGYVDQLSERICFFRQLLVHAGVNPSAAIQDAIAFSWEMSEASYEAFRRILPG